jgi:hypothetical protein
MDYFFCRGGYNIVCYLASSMSCCVGVLTVHSLHSRLLEYVKCMLITSYFPLSVMQPKGLSGPIQELARRRLYQEVRNIHCIET